MQSIGGGMHLDWPYCPLNHKEAWQVLWCVNLLGTLEFPRRAPRKKHRMGNRGGNCLTSLCLSLPTGQYSSYDKLTTLLPTSKCLPLAHCGCRDICPRSNERLHSSFILDLVVSFISDFSFSLSPKIVLQNS